RAKIPVLVDVLGWNRAAADRLGAVVQRVHSLEPEVSAVRIGGAPSDRFSADIGRVHHSRLHGNRRCARRVYFRDPGRGVRELGEALPSSLVRPDHRACPYQEINRPLGNGESSGPKSWPKSIRLPPRSFPSMWKLPPFSKPCVRASNPRATEVYVRS